MPERRTIEDADFPLNPVTDPTLQTDPTSQTDVTQAAAVEPQNGVPADIDASIAGTMIVFESVTKVYEPNVVALNDVSFVIDKGEFVFVVGASGSGKSTMIRLLLKELEPSAGRILVGGRDLTRLKHSKVPLLRRNVGCVFQDFKLLPNRTAGENVALRAQGAGRERGQHPAQGARGALAGRALQQERLAAGRALWRRAAARLDRARRRQLHRRS